jgi:hypothetical protein
MAKGHNKEKDRRRKNSSKKKKNKDVEKHKLEQDKPENRSDLQDVTWSNLKITKSYLYRKRRKD